MPKLMGPIEELRDMNLVNFRRLGDDAEVAIRKVREKINLLEEEGYSKKLAGISAWRQSPIYKLYLRTGQESINGGKSVIDVIEGKRERGEDYVTSREFSAIMDLNKSLRF